MVKMSKEQQRTLKWKYRTNPDGSKSFLAFRRRVVGGFFGCVMLEYCGYWLGIELDGHPHS